MRVLLALSVVGLLVACKVDGTVQTTTTAVSLDSKVACYSGGQKIYDGESDGMVHISIDNDMWYFTEKGTGDDLSITGTCVVRRAAR